MTTGKPKAPAKRVKVARVEHSTRRVVPSPSRPSLSASSTAYHVKKRSSAEVVAAMKRADILNVSGKLTAEFS